MSVEDQLLICLAEECAEVQKEITKALRFGLDDVYKDKSPRRKTLVDELNDIFAIIELLQEHGTIPYDLQYPERIIEKCQRTKHFLERSKVNGRVANPT